MTGTNIGTVLHGAEVIDSRFAGGEGDQGRHPPNRGLTAVQDRALPGIRFRRGIFLLHAQNGICFARGNAQGATDQPGRVIIVQQGDIQGGGFSNEPLGNSAQAGKQQRLARVLLAADDLRAPLPQLPEPAELILRFAQRRLRHDGQPLSDPFRDGLGHVPPIHRDYREVRPEGQAFLFIRGRRNPRAGRHEGLLLLRPAQEHGPEESRIGFGHAAEVFGPVSGTDNQIFQHAFFLRDRPARRCRGA